MAERRNLSLSASAIRTLDALCEIEGTTQAQVVERAVETRLGLMELVLKLPKDERGRLARLCVLPERARVPEGAEVFRLYVAPPESVL